MRSPKQQPEQSAKDGGCQDGFGNEPDGGDVLFHDLIVRPPTPKIKIASPFPGGGENHHCGGGLLAAAPACRYWLGFKAGKTYKGEPRIAMSHEPEVRAMNLRVARFGLAYVND
jgi:hypothetical protein